MGASSPTPAPGPDTPTASACARLIDNPAPYVWLGGEALYFSGAVSWHIEGFLYALGAWLLVAAVEWLRRPTPANPKPPETP